MTSPQTSLVDLESKVKSQRLIFSVIAGALFFVGYHLGSESQTQALATSQQDFINVSQALAKSNAQLKELKLELEKAEKNKRSDSSKKRSSKKSALNEFESCILKDEDNALISADKVMWCNIGNDEDEIAMKKCVLTNGFSSTAYIELNDAISCWKKNH